MESGIKTCFLMAVLCWRVCSVNWILWDIITVIKHVCSWWSQDNRCCWVWMSCYWLTRVLPGAEEQARNRFQLELEFVQCLANPNYLNCEWCCDQKLSQLHVCQSLTEILCVCVSSSGSERHPEGQILHQLPEVPAVLEGARVRQVPQVRRHVWFLV